MFSKKIIYGCEGRGDHNSPYLTRYTLIDTKLFQVCIHVFHRSDADDMHDHPWPFTSVIVWRGYYEQTPCPENHEPVIEDGYIKRYRYCNTCKSAFGDRVKKRVWPGMVLFRKSTHQHRVELVKGKRAVTLVFMGKRVREWGFFTRAGWVQWIEYFKSMGC